MHVRAFERLETWFLTKAPGHKDGRLLPKSPLQGGLAVLSCQVEVGGVRPEAFQRKELESRSGGPKERHLRDRRRKEKSEVYSIIPFPFPTLLEPGRKRPQKSSEASS